MSINIEIELDAKQWNTKMSKRCVALKYATLYILTYKLLKHVNYMFKKIQKTRLDFYITVVALTL